MEVKIKHKICSVKQFISIFLWCNIITFHNHAESHKLAKMYIICHDKTNIILKHKHKGPISLSKVHGWICSRTKNYYHVKKLQMDTTECQSSMELIWRIRHASSFTRGNYRISIQTWSSCVDPHYPEPLEYTSAFALCFVLQDVNMFLYWLTDVVQVLMSSTDR